jgi:hypothetical protein
LAPATQQDPQQRQDAGKIIVTVSPGSLLSPGSFWPSGFLPRRRFVWRSFLPPGFFVPGFFVPGLFVPGFFVPGFFVPGLFVPGFFVPGLFVPGLFVPGLFVPGLFVPGLFVPGLFVPGFFVPGFFVPGLFVPGLFPLGLFVPGLFPRSSFSRGSRLPSGSLLSLGSLFVARLGVSLALHETLQWLLLFQNQVNDGSVRTGCDPPGRLPTSLSLAGLPGQERAGSSEHPKPGRPRVRAAQLSKA